MQPKRDPYSVLGLPPNASPEEIQAAYKKRAAETHPRRQLEELRKAKREFSEVNRAFQELTRPKHSETQATVPQNQLSLWDQNWLYPGMFFRDNFRRGLWDVADFGLTKEFENSLFNFDDPFISDDFFRIEPPHGPLPENSTYHSKSVNSQTLIENGKKKRITTKICNDNGQVKQETKEEEWDGQGGYNSRILPGSTRPAVEQGTEKPAIEKK